MNFQIDTNRFKYAFTAEDESLMAEPSLFFGKTDKYTIYPEFPADSLKMMMLVREPGTTHIKWLFDLSSRSYSLNLLACLGEIFKEFSYSAQLFHFGYIQDIVTYYFEDVRGFRASEKQKLTNKLCYNTILRQTQTPFRQIHVLKMQEHVLIKKFYREMNNECSWWILNRFRKQYMFMMKNREGDLVKITSSIFPEGKIAQLRRLNHDAWLVNTWFSGNSAFEKVYNQYRQYSNGGDWYRLTANQLADIAMSLDQYPQSHPLKRGKKMFRVEQYSSRPWQQPEQKNIVTKLRKLTQRILEHLQGR